MLNISLKKKTLIVHLYYTLRREYLDMIPEFTGISELLPRFIQVSEKLVNKFYNTGNPDDFQNEYLMSSILAKIKSEAATNISSCHINNWNDLKIALISCYADKRDIFTLTSEISEQKQEPYESPFDLHSKLQQLLNLQIAYITTNFPVDEAKTLCIFFRNYTLRNLLKGLIEPIGSPIFK